MGVPRPGFEAVGAAAGGGEDEGGVVAEQRGEPLRRPRHGGSNAAAGEARQIWAGRRKREQ